jgi:multiple sugar transport system permease protein
MMEVDTSFAGFIHYAQLFKDARLWQALLHTFIITIIALPLELVLGLLMAQLFLERMPGRQIFVSLLVLPTVISPIVAGATWRLMFDNRYGPINQIIGWFAGEPMTILWTVNPNLVYPSIFICEVWQWTPFMFLILFAGLRTLPREPFEAARVDGASDWQIFWDHTFPMLLPASVAAILLRAIEAFKLFDVVFYVTGGGPGGATSTVTLQGYFTALRSGNLGYGAAMSIVLLVTVMALAMAALIWLKRLAGRRTRRMERDLQAFSVEFRERTAA